MKPPVALESAPFAPHFDRVREARQRGGITLRGYRRADVGESPHVLPGDSANDRPRERIDRPRYARERSRRATILAKLEQHLAFRKDVVAKALRGRRRGASQRTLDDPQRFVKTPLGPQADDENQSASFWLLALPVCESVVSRRSATAKFPARISICACSITSSSVPIAYRVLESMAARASS